MAAIKKNGDVWELASKALGAVISAAMILGFFISVVAWAFGAKLQLANATPTARHDSLVKVVHDIDTTVAGINRNVLGLNCNQSGYPSPFCDNVPRVMPSTTPRRTR